MYLQPDSNLLGETSETNSIPQQLQHYLVSGYTHHLIKAKGLNLLTQHYEHAELDIYLHHIQTEKPLRLIAKAASNRMVVGYLIRGNITIFFYDGSTIPMLSPTMLFFKAHTGKEIQLDCVTGNHEMICCCLKPSFEKSIFQWFPMLIDHSTNPCHFHVSHWVHYQWRELWSNELPTVLYHAFVGERIRTLLRHLVIELLAFEKSKTIHLLHPGVPVSVVEKAYSARQLIDSKIGQPLSLKSLVQLTRWNLQGLKQGFVQVFGISPHRYMIQQRMRIALTMVQQTDQPIQTIADSCGYRQAHHFIRQFKIAYGKTPGEMRKELH